MGEKKRSKITLARHGIKYLFLVKFPGQNQSELMVAQIEILLHATRCNLHGDASLGGFAKNSEALRYGSSRQQIREPIAVSSYSRTRSILLNYHLPAIRNRAS